MRTMSSTINVACNSCAGVAAHLNPRKFTAKGGEGGSANAVSWAPAPARHANAGGGEGLPAIQHPIQRRSSLWTGSPGRWALGGEFRGQGKYPREPGTESRLPVSRKLYCEAPGWSGRPSNHLTQRDECLYPRGGSAGFPQFQHTAEPDFARKQEVARRHPACAPLCGGGRRCAANNEEGVYSGVGRLPRAICRPGSAAQGTVGTGFGPRASAGSLRTTPTGRARSGLYSRLRRRISFQRSPLLSVRAATSRMVTPSWRTS